MLVVALLMMGVSTTLIGCLPTYSSIGIAAPLLLVVLRFVQGLAIDGQWAGAVLSCYVAGASVVTLLATFLLKETHEQPMPSRAAPATADPGA